MHSPWVGIDLAADRVAWARLLRRAHEVALAGQGTPAVLRPLVVRSWTRCREAGVDPERPAPLVLGAEDAARRLAAHPLGGIVPLVRRMLAGVADDARHLVALGDADGLLLWTEGHPSMVEAAAAPNLRPGGPGGEGGGGTACGGGPSRSASGRTSWGRWTGAGRRTRRGRAWACRRWAPTGPSRGCS